MKFREILPTRMGVTSQDNSLFTCTTCQKSFISQTSLKKHERSHSKLTVVRKYPCPDCSHVCLTPGHLQQHMRVHSDLRPFKCEVCEKTFNQKSNLTRHARIHSGEKPYVCEICGRAFIESGKLTKHRRVHLKLKNYQCTVCGKQFAENRNLTQHLLIHTGEKPHRCQTCDRAFRFVTDLREHQLVHSEIKAFLCSVCGRAFKSNRNLKTHMKTFHKNDPGKDTTNDKKGTLKKCSLKTPEPKLNTLNNQKPHRAASISDGQILVTSESQTSAHSLPVAPKSSSSTTNSHFSITPPTFTTQVLTVPQPHPSSTPVTKTWNLSPSPFQDHHQHQLPHTFTNHIPATSSAFPDEFPAPDTLCMDSPVLSVQTEYPLEIAAFDEFHPSISRQEVLPDGGSGGFQVSDHVLLDISHSNQQHLHTEVSSSNIPVHQYLPPAVPHTELYSTTSSQNIPIANSELIQSIPSQSHQTLNIPNPHLHQISTTGVHYVSHLQSAKLLLSVGECSLRTHPDPKHLVYQISTGASLHDETQVSVENIVTTALASLVTVTPTPSFADHQNDSSGLQIISDHQPDILKNADTYDLDFGSSSLATTISSDHVGTPACYGWTIAAEFPPVDLIEDPRLVQETGYSDLQESHIQVVTVDLPEDADSDETAASVDCPTSAAMEIPEAIVWKKSSSLDPGTSSVAIDSVTEINNKTARASPHGADHWDKARINFSKGTVEDPGDIAPSSDAMQHHQQNIQTQINQVANFVTSTRKISELKTGIETDDCIHDSIPADSLEVNSLSRSSMEPQPVTVETPDKPVRETRSVKRPLTKSKNKLSNHSENVRGIVSDNMGKVSAEDLGSNAPIINEANPSDVGIKKFKCSVCFKLFTHKGSLSQHMRAHSDDVGNGVIQCSTCLKTFSKRSNLNQHMKIHEGVRPFSCDDCGKKFLLKRSLESHQKVHSEQKPFKCPTCDRGFKFQRDLVNHGRIHSGDKPYLCSHCGKSFSLSSSLNRHYRTHTGATPYTCKVCGRSFSQNGNMHQHMRSHNAA